MKRILITRACLLSPGLTGGEGEFHVVEDKLARVLVNAHQARVVTEAATPPEPEPLVDPKKVKP